MSSKGKRTPLANGLTPKENRYRDVLIQQIHEKGEINGTQAALAVYDTTSKSVADAISRENLAKPRIRESIEQELNSIGLSRKKLMENIGKIADKGIKEDQEVSPDMVLKSNVELLKLIGAYPKAGSGSSGVQGNSFTFINLGYDEAKKQLSKLDSENAEFIDDADS